MEKSQTQFFFGKACLFLFALEKDKDENGSDEDDEAFFNFSACIF